MEAIIQLANRLELNVTGEGIENDSQLLFEKGCGGYQGYYYSEPMPVSEMMQGAESGT